MKKFWIILSVSLVIIIGFISLIFIRFPKKYMSTIEKYAIENNLPIYMVASVINIESGFNEMSLSHAGAMGLMQLKLSTASDMAKILGVKVDKVNIFDTELNIMLGTKYLAYLLEMFDGNETNALVAYNWGLQNVKDWIMDGNVTETGTITNIPVRETRNYLKKYRLNRFVYKNLYGKE